MKKDKQPKSAGAAKFVVTMVLIICVAAAAAVWYHFNKSSVVPGFGKIEVVSGDAVCVLPGEKFTVALRTLDKEKSPFKNCKVIPKFSAPANCVVTPAEGVSDAGGVVRFEIVSGNRIGDNYITFQPDVPEARPIEVRFVNGVKLIGDQQDPVGQACVITVYPSPEVKVDPAGKCRSRRLRHCFVDKGSFPGKTQDQPLFFQSV